MQCLEDSSESIIIKKIVEKSLLTYVYRTSKMSAWHFVLKHAPVFPAHIYTTDDIFIAYRVQLIRLLNTNNHKYCKVTYQYKVSPDTLPQDRTY